MTYKLGVSGFGRFFNVPCGAVDNYLKLASGDFYKVLLAALCSDSMILDTEDIALRCGLSPSVVEEALLFWSGAGVIALESENGSMQAAAVPAAVSVSSVAQQAVPSAANVTEQLPVSGVEPVLPTKNHAERTHVRYSPKELAQKAKDDKNISTLFDEIQKVFGRQITGTDSAALIDLYEYYGFDVPSILILAQYCTDIGKNRLAYMQSVARDWYSRGISSYQQIEQEIVRLTKQNGIDHKLCSVLGVEEPPTKKQKEYFSQWTEWGYSVEMVAVAGEICRDQKNKTDLRYINGIIKRWHNDGIFTPEALEKSEQKYQQSSAASSDKDKERSYDLNIWHQMAENIDFDNIKFGSGDDE